MLIFVRHAESANNARCDHDDGRAPPKSEDAPPRAPDPPLTSRGRAQARAAAAALARRGGLPAPPSFVAASAFRGARDGYVFKKGARGLGYYREWPIYQRALVISSAMRRALETAAPIAAALKTHVEVSDRNEYPS